MQTCHFELAFSGTKEAVTWHCLGDFNPHLNMFPWSTISFVKHTFVLPVGGGGYTFETPGMSVQENILSDKNQCMTGNL